MNLNELAKDIHDNAVEHGWWDEERSFGEVIALCHSELSEALEEYRNDKTMIYCKACGIEQKCEDGESCVACLYSHYNDVNGIKIKPEGIAVELADCIIRILDWCGKEGIDIEQIIHLKHEYNKTRPYRHGGKRC